MNVAKSFPSDTTRNNIILVRLDCLATDHKARGAEGVAAMAEQEQDCFCDRINPVVCDRTFILCIRLEIR
jgi:hypothetical protein